MAATRFDLVSDWYFDTPVERIWAELITPEAWPDWWRAVKKVEVLSEGDTIGVGAVRRFTWGTALPYTLSFNMTATKIEPMRLIEGEARGELDGLGRWTLTPEGQGQGTHVRYDWMVDVTKPWQVALSPILRPVFAWNHNIVLGWGQDDLKTRLRKTAN
ncbi:MAG: SRPBCC family protein [Devosia sp.]